VRERRENAAGLLWVSPWVLGFAAFMLLPMGMSLAYSFTEYPMLEAPVWIGLESYARMLGDAKFWGAVWNTGWYALATIPLCTALALAVAAMLAKRTRMVGFFQAAIFLPTLVPMIASAMVWMWLFNGEYGLINRLLGLVGIAGPAWLFDKAWAAAGLVLIAMWGVGQQVLVYVAALRDVPEQLYEAADLDGMGPLRKFFYVTLPMISPVVLFNVITLMIGTLQVFALPLALFQKNKGGPGGVANFYTSYMYDKAFIDGEMGYACALAWVQLLAVLTLTGLLFLVSRRAVHYRGA
jgi:multiple sugar transport system permease protein